jgi:cytochrome c553
MQDTSKRWRPRVIGLAAAIVCASAVSAQPVALAERIVQCGGCHGEDGNSRVEKIPSLAGQPEFFVLNQLFLMREGVRKVEVMTPFVKDLKDADLEALSKHYGQLAAKPSDEPVDPTLVKRGTELSDAKRCASCHLPTMAGRDQMPRLARQRIDYLVHSMKEFRDGTRSAADTLMSNVVAGMSDADLTALAHYVTSK